MNRIFALAFVSVLAVFLCAPSAHAAASIDVLQGLQSPRLPQESPSSVETVTLYWYVTVDCFAVGLLTGTSFAAPDVLTNFDHVSWAQTTGLADYADAEGDPFPVVFDLNFVAPLAVGTEILVAGYAAGNLLSNTHGEYFGGDSWYFQDVESEWDPKGEVPEPGTLLLVGSGLAAAALRRRRR